MSNSGNPQNRSSDGPVQSVDDDLNQLERGIRELKIQYDRFFIGALAREPLQLKFALKKIIKRYSESPLKSYGHRFRFNSLVARFNVMNELWMKNTRRMEGGDQRHNAQQEVDLGLVSRCRLSDPNGQTDALRGIHKEFTQHRIRNGVVNPKVPFDRFVSGIAAQAAKLKAQSGCQDVEIRLVVRDQKVQLSARPLHRGHAPSADEPSTPRRPKSAEPEPAVPATSGPSRSR